MTVNAHRIEQRHAIGRRLREWRLRYLDLNLTAEAKSYAALFAKAKRLAAICGIVTGAAFNYVPIDRLVFRLPSLSYSI